MKSWRTPIKLKNYNNKKEEIGLECIDREETCNESFISPLETDSEGEKQPDSSEGYGGELFDVCWLVLHVFQPELLSVQSLGQPAFVFQNKTILGYVMKNISAKPQKFATMPSGILNRRDSYYDTIDAPFVDSNACTINYGRIKRRVILKMRLIVIAIISIIQHQCQSLQNQNLDSSFRGPSNISVFPRRWWFCQTMFCQKVF